MGSVEDKYREASKAFLTAAAYFDRVKAEAANLRTPDFGVDLTEPNLLMCAYIMKAQAQNAAHEKIKRSAPDKHPILSKLAMQAAIFYGKAYSIVTTPPVCKAADPKNFVAILQFNEHAFMAQADYWKALQFMTQCDQSAEGMGKAVAHIDRATAYIESLRKLEKSLSPVILTQFRELATLLNEKRAYFHDQNSKIYHETVPEPDTNDSLVYGEAVKIEGDLSKPFEGQEAFASLVPQGVRDLEREYKDEVNGLFAASFQRAQDLDVQQQQLFARHNLPSCLQAVSGEQRVPSDLLARVKQCRERGGNRALEHMIEGKRTMAENNKTTLEQMAKQLEKEEQEDQSLRAKYGPLWSRPPSQVTNAECKSKVASYAHKLSQAQAADDQLQTSFNAQKDALALLELSEEELTAQLPVSHVPGHVSPATAK